MKRLVVALAVFLSALPAVAARTFGDSDCGKWLAPEARDFRKVWLMGYMSGLSTAYSAYKSDGLNPLAELGSAEQAVLWMDNWCRANPLDMVSTGGAQLFMELRERSQKK